jgi:O-antigen/teichoic acid export membrane protein
VGSLLKVSQQTFWQVLGKIISALSTLIILKFITSTYGPTGTGIFTLATTYLAFFFLITDLGLNAYVLPNLDSDPKSASRLFNSRFYWSLLMVVFANIIALLLPFRGYEFNLSVLIGSLAIVLSGVFNSTNLIYQKRLKYYFSAISSSIGALVSIPIVYFLTLWHSPVYLITIGFLVSWLSISLASLFFVSRFYQFKLAAPDFFYLINVLKKAWPISLTLLLNIVYFRADSFILSILKGFSDVGIYNFAFQFFQTALVLPTFIMNGYYPLMVKSYQNNLSKFISQVKIAGFLMAGIALVGVFLTYLLSPILINLIGGPEFIGSDVSLKILSLSFPAYFISAVLMWTFVTMKKYKTMLLIYAIGLAVNLVLNLIFIPKYSYIASAYITGISEYLILILQIIMLWKVLKEKE